ncbi:MAG TPA: hypothetical protein VFS67_23545 [Polyangiaceae bacterium]|nr:hypothetical protein [Polyangiaceae bacterium]
MNGTLPHRICASALRRITRSAEAEDLRLSHSTQTSEKHSPERLSIGRGRHSSKGRSDASPSSLAFPSTRAERELAVQLILYYVTAGLLLALICLSSWLMQSRLGRLLIAMRTKEERVRFTGYDTASLKVFVFVFAAVVSGIGGALFTLIVGFMSPSFVGIVPSIEMVIATAVGGRHSLLGAIYGSLLVNYGKTFFSESLPELWLFLLGGLFIGVVMGFPNGLAGIDLRRLLDQSLLAKLRARWTALPGALPRIELERVAAAPSQPQHEVPR